MTEEEMLAYGRLVMERERLEVGEFLRGTDGGFAIAIHGERLSVRLMGVICAEDVATAIKLLRAMYGETKEKAQALAEAEAALAGKEVEVMTNAKRLN